MIIDHVKVYLASRWINGFWYIIQLPALDETEAKAICLRNSWRFEGELMGVYSGSAAGFIAKLKVWWKNWTAHAS